MATSSKLCRVVGHEYQIFEIIEETTEEVIIKQLTPVFDPTTGDLQRENKPFSVFKEDVIDDTDASLRLFTKLYLKSIVDRINQLYAMQNSYHIILSRLDGSDKNQSHR